MYYRTLTNSRTYSLFTWSYITGRCATKLVTKINSAIKQKKKPSNKDMSEDYQGSVQPWSNGPPSISGENKMNKNTKVIKYDENAFSLEYSPPLR